MFSGSSRLKAEVKRLREELEAAQSGRKRAEQQLDASQRALELKSNLIRKLQLDKVNLESEVEAVRRASSDGAGTPRTIGLATPRTPRTPQSVGGASQQRGVLDVDMDAVRHFQSMFKQLRSDLHFGEDSPEFQRNVLQQSRRTAALQTYLQSLAKLSRRFCDVRELATNCRTPTQPLAHNPALLFAFVCLAAWCVVL